MTSFNLKGLILASIGCLLMIACGGGGGVTAGGGIDGTGIMSAGVISAFGSIVVNGTEFDTSEAEIIVNGVPVGVGDETVENNFQVGMVVTVEGRVFDDESAVADRVVYSSNVFGPVEAIGLLDPATNEKEIVVLGQTVVVNFITEFKGTSFNTVEVDNVVEVSGHRDFDGKIRATYVEDITDQNIAVYEVIGFVANLDNPTPNTFVINDLTIDYSSISPEDLPENFDNGLFVEVEGEVDDNSGHLVADEIRLADTAVGEEVEEIEIMGYVTEIISANGIIKFKIGNQEVHVDRDPDIVEYVDGGPADIARGQRLEAEGSFEGGILNAWEIEFWKPDQIEIEEIVTEVVSATEFKFEKILIQTDDDTVFEPEDLVVDNSLVGREIEVKGVPQNLEKTVIKADKVSFELE